MRLIAPLLLLLLLICSGTASAWLSGYDHRIEVTINNGGGSTLTDYQFNFTNDTNVLVAMGHMNANGSDCRITDSSDNLIPFWNETAFNAASTKIWANDTLTTGDNMFYMYYGDAGASSVADGDTTFTLFDDFERSDITNSWDRYAGNPVLVKNATNSWDSYFVNDPKICKYLNGSPYKDVSGNYFMYHCGSGHDDGLNNDQIGLAISNGSNLSDWTRYANGDGGRVLKFGSGTFEDGQWDDADVQLGVVLYDSGVFHMWYDGNNNPTNDFCRLGYANSTDGKTWTKYGSNPILSQGPDGDADDMYAPRVIYDNNTWKMWYGGQKTGGGRIALMYATASNPQGPWTKYSTAQIYDPGYDMFPAEIWNESGTFHMIFFPLNVTDLRHATSTDGITWTYDKIIFGLGDTDAWDDHHIQECSQINVSGTWYSFYTGGGASGVFSCGYATSTTRLPPSSKWTVNFGTEGTNLRLHDGKLEVGMTANPSGVISATIPASFVINAYMDFAVTGSNTGYSDVGPSNANIQSHSGFDSYISTSQWNLYKFPANTNTQFGTAANGYKDVEIFVQAASQKAYIGSDSTTSDTNFGATDPYVRIYGNNGITYVEYIFVRKYTATEPTSSLGAEESAAPVITNLTNSTPQTTSVTITWDTDISSNNRVYYGTNETEINAWTNGTWSSWHNTTTSISIGLSGLSANTTYYYKPESRDVAINQSVAAENFTTAESTGIETFVNPSFVSAGAAAILFVATAGRFAISAWRNRRRKRRN